MAEASQYSVPYTELAEVLVKHLNIHEGFWSVYLRFGINAANFSLNDAPFMPTAIVPVLQIGINRDSERTPLSVDAAEVNPVKGGSKASRKAKK